MRHNRIRQFTIRLVETQAVTRDDLRAIKRLVAMGDCYTREEIEDILAIDRVISGRCDGWQDFVTDVVVAHLVWESRPTGYVRAEDAAWLMAQLGGQAAPAGGRARALAQAVIREAQSADESLIAFAMGAEPQRAMRFASMGTSDSEILRFCA